MSKKIGAVLVVGGGISGIQASLDLANSGFKVYLVDEAPSIGGKMAQLDKTFPTNDCSMCILSPKLVECERNPNIEIIPYAEIKEVEGEAGNFDVTLIKKPRYVDGEKCIGCGFCAQYCPVEIFDSFNENLSKYKCIHLPYPQAVPSVSVIDADSCLYLKKKACKICRYVCKHRAITLDSEAEEFELKVGAIILSPGYETFDPRLKSEYGYGKFANVITSLEFERILSAFGPGRGEIFRPSDNKIPSRIAWIQCVGSRDKTLGRDYCSSVCCMYAAKQSILVKEYHKDIQTAIFYIDVRPFGKGFERFFVRAKEEKVRYIHAIPSEIKEITSTKSLSLRYCTDEGKIKEKEFDLVILSVGLGPPKNAKVVAGKLSIEIDQYGFPRNKGFSLIETSRPGIYAAGAFTGPHDIPDSVQMGSGAASLSSQLLSSVRGTLITERTYPSERDISEEEAKVGVFICHCGTNIASTVDVPSMVNHAKSLEGVTHAEENLFSCSADSLKHITETIEEKGMNRVVVAACTPRTHEPIFQDTLREASLNPYLFEMANIREHCSWVHEEKNRANEKAKELITMAVAKARLLQPLKLLSLPVVSAGLVIGGGISGMVSALSLAKQGFKAYLVEKENELGGIARKLHFTLEGNNPQDFLTDLIRQIYGDPLIQVYTQALVKEISGWVGNFSTKILLNTSGEEHEIKHGVIVVASGGEEYKPKDYLYGKDPRVMTLLELEKAISQGEPKLKDCSTLVMILCVGSRDEERPYCSRVCCSQAIKCALKLNEINKDMGIYILNRDIVTYGLKEIYYQEARNRGVIFVRFDPEDKPEVNISEEGILRVLVKDTTLGKRLAIDTDILALGTAVIPASGNKDLASMLKVPLDRDGFFLEAHIKLRPVDFANDGIFMCGLCHSPKHIEESIVQAQAAASRASTILSQKEITTSGVIAYIDEEKCFGCGICESLCPFNAIRMKQVNKKRKAEVIPVSCKGCGICVPRCPRSAITIGGFTDEEILSEIDALAKV